MILTIIVTVIITAIITYYVSLCLFKEILWVKCGDRAVEEYYKAKEKLEADEKLNS